MSKRSDRDITKILVEVYAQSDLSAFDYTKESMKINDTEAEFFLSVFLVQAIRALDLIYNSNKDDYLDIRFKLLKIRIDNPLNSHQSATFKGNDSNIQRDCFSLLDMTANHFMNFFENDDIETFDHGVLFTRRKDFNTVLGCTRLGGICDRTHKYSTINLKHFSVFEFIILAHEVGHNLGMSHTNNGKRSKKNKILSFLSLIQ
jgi:hypothetical protein